LIYNPSLFPFLHITKCLQNLNFKASLPGFGSWFYHLQLRDDMPFVSPSVLVGKMGMIVADLGACEI
jgi:hypothetical protein